MSQRLVLMLIGAAVLVAAGGVLQVWNSNVFWCGREESHPQVIAIAALVLVQAFLYLLRAGEADRWGLYRTSQLLVLPLLLLGLFQAFKPYPGTAILLATLFALPAAWMRLRRHSAGWPWSGPATCGYFATCALGTFAAIGQVPLLQRGVGIGYPYIALGGLGAAALSLLVLHHLRNAEPSPRRTLADFTGLLPFSVLLLPVLRAKFPDVAHDSYLYKVTLPMQIAEWRTGDTAIIDGFMVGTNLQELLNALLILVAPGYNPSLISTIAYVLLFLVTPAAFRTAAAASPISRGIAAFAGLATFVLTEAAIAQGTSYQEPLMLLFLVAAMVRTPIWPLFMALAIMVKVNAIFIAPVMLVYHLSGYGRFWRDPRLLLAGSLAFVLAMAPHLERNIAFSGRLLGLNETLAALTDPPGPGAILAAGGTRYDEFARGGVLNNALMSACNMLALKQICATEYEGSENAGFHMFPASRSPLFGLVLVLLAVGSALRRREDRLLAFASSGAFLLSYAALLAFMSEGRYFMPLSFAFGPLLLMNLRPAEHAVRACGASSLARGGAIAAGCLLVGSNLLPGVMSNVSWICNRNLLRPATTVDLRVPQTGLQRFLAARLDAYKALCPPPGLPPVILAEHGAFDSPYLGTQRISHVYTQEMIARFFRAQPARRDAAAEAIIAVVARSPGYPASMLGDAMADFTPCFAEGADRAYCSLRLAPATSACARSLYEVR